MQKLERLFQFIGLALHLPGKRTQTLCGNAVDIGVAQKQGGCAIEQEEGICELAECAR